ncbi:MULTISPECIES: AraC family transcriptional regulator [Vibrio]|uniref:AraC family transcriptional regulator n=1 Tax=Vibrio TaxID=662 RepID=UPI000C170FA1|nr:MULTISPECIES: AraC family transcriptional regulator [Vibrio]NAW68249.1 helix-turn-helix domain-containing protein [Vibrio sp. V28_P6S34P95]NAX06316.1 helix-turn-helix domain-containing protein [Vibrio sp. V30_P3S12P165]NAX33830.1 helix-turn-helix domain-containing protein [Vibrio sp. V29_P1S30P107]NAX38270.1 helix-turn-helix domain-containing protein [Vibrio sp. V27_P1S3P104]NAX40173.1 helix-turn-helix domain-containing protein [Vibrio sp. V26_P1S5P106]
MDDLASLMQRYVEKYQLEQLEGCIETAIPGVWFYRSRQGNERQPFIYQSGIIILGQGYKQVHLGATSVEYGPNDYLVVGVPMPLECEAIAKNNQPLLGLTIDIDHSLLLKQVAALEQYGFEPNANSRDNACGLQCVKMNDAMLASSKRLIAALLNGLEAQLLGASLLEEMVFRALTSSEGHVLFELAHQEGHYARIAKALSRVHRDYATRLTVHTLAEEASMSVSAFHQAFRDVTLASPLQYLKKVRLNKAKELIQVEGKRVSDAARLVGYTSPSQFSREYKRHFNQTPRGTLPHV